MIQVLYVEDNDDNIYMLSRRLKRKSFDVLIAKDGQEGIGGGIISTVVGGTSKPQMTLEEKKQVIEFVETLPDLEDVKDYIVENAKGGNIERGAAKRSYDTIKNYKEAPANTPLSDSISKNLKKRGFKFVGTTVVYAHMQTTGMVNDHEISCFRYDEV